MSLLVKQAASLSAEIQHPASSIQPPAPHGGPRTPGPGKKLGRPKKPAKDRAVTTTIVLSSRKASQALKRQARKAKLTPGALIERELGL